MDQIQSLLFKSSGTFLYNSGQATLSPCTCPVHHFSCGDLVSCTHVMNKMLTYTSSISLELYAFLILSILKSFQCAVVKSCLTLVLDILTLPINDNNYPREERPKDYSRKNSIGVSDFNNQPLSVLNKTKNCVDPKKVEKQPRWQLNHDVLK